MWPEAKIQSQKEYFAAQRKQPTGNFTEYVVRTYYCIYKACSKHQRNSCPAKEVSNYRIKNVVYEGFYNNKPDHDYQNVIDNCKKHLIECGQRSPGLQTHKRPSGRMGRTQGPFPHHAEGMADKRGERGRMRYGFHSVNLRPQTNPPCPT